MSESMVKKARAELTAGGYILHEAFGGNKPAGYWILSCIRPEEVLAPKGTTLPAAKAGDFDKSGGDGFR